jgi:hypothetical protein
MSLESNGVMTLGAGVTLLFLVDVRLGEWATLLLVLTLLLLEGVAEAALFVLVDAILPLLTILFVFGEPPCVVCTTADVLLLRFELALLGVTTLLAAAAPLLLLHATGSDEKDTEYTGAVSVVLMMAGGEMPTQFLLFAVVTATAVLATFATDGFFSPRSQYVVTFPFPLNRTKRNPSIKWTI